MNPKHQPTTAAGRMDRLIEEAGEVLQAIGKARRFGIDNCYDKARHCVCSPAYAKQVGIESNREALIRELQDLREATNLVLCDLLSRSDWEKHNDDGSISKSPSPIAHEATLRFPRVESAGMRGAMQQAMDERRESLRKMNGGWRDA